MRTFHLLLPLLMLAHSGALHAQSITGYRYWFNDDVSTMVTTSVTSGAQYTLNSLNTDALTHGHQRVTLQLSDAAGEWSAPVTYTFHRGGGGIANWEHWFDDDHGTSVQTSVAPTTLLDVAALVGAGQLAQGSHTITVRVADQLGGHSVPVTYAFDTYTSIDELPGVTHLTLFPNPVQDRLMLIVGTWKPLELHTSVLDAQGRSASGPVRSLVAGTSTLVVPIDGLASGPYHLLVQGPDGRTDIPFIVP